MKCKRNQKKIELVEKVVETDILLEANNIILRNQRTISQQYPHYEKGKCFLIKHKGVRKYTISSSELPKITKSI